jgi:uncharacterized protein YaeQ
MGPIREDFAGQRQLRFRVEGKSIHLFKHKGESTHQVYLRILVYALYHDRYPELEIEPKLSLKYHPCVASADWTGEVKFWAQCGQVPVEQIAYVLKHTEADEVAFLKRQIHYRYTTGRLRVLLFAPLDQWFDPDHVEADPDHYQLIEF